MGSSPCHRRPCPTRRCWSLASRPATSTPISCAGSRGARRDEPQPGRVCETLKVVPVEPAMFGLAGIAAATWHAGTDQAKHLKLAEEIFVGRPGPRSASEVRRGGPPSCRLQRAAPGDPDAAVARPRRRGRRQGRHDRRTSRRAADGDVGRRRADGALCRPRAQRPGSRWHGCRGWSARAFTSTAPTSAATRAAPARSSSTSLPRPILTVRTGAT